MHIHAPHLLAAALALGAVPIAVARAHPPGDSQDHSSHALMAAPIVQPERRPGRAPEGPAGVPGGPHAPMEVVALPEPTVSVTIEGPFRVVRANGLPAHAVGSFPNRDNPNALRPQSHEIRLPLEPRVGEKPIEARPEFGIALNGVIFDSGTGEFWTAQSDRAFGGGSPWNYDALGAGVPFGLDQNNAHVQPTGKYHYHGVPVGLLDTLVQENGPNTMIQLGWAYDGFPIYAARGHAQSSDATSELIPLRSSYRLKVGVRPERPEGPGGEYDGTFGLDWEYVQGSGDLDECNGRFGVTPEFPQGTYYYAITTEFPSIPRMWAGQPDESMRRHGPGGQGGPGARPSGRAEGSAAASQAKRGDRPQDARPVNPAFFIDEALAAPIAKEERALADGTKTLCYVIRTYSEPQEHEMGPWAPTHIEDGADKGGIWFREGEVFDVDGPFVRDIAKFYGDAEWKLYRDDGSIKITDTKEAFEAAARPDVDARFNNYVVEGRPEWIDRRVFEYVIPVQPVYQAEPILIGPAQRGPERGARSSAPPQRGQRGSPPGPRGGDAGDPQHGGPGQMVLGVAFNGVKFDPPAPLDAILAAHTIAPFDDAGGHLNPHEGYHYHAVTGHTKEIAQPDGHAPMIGYIMDGYALFAHKNQDGSAPTDLDECGGHSDEIRGYHYHAAAPGENRIIRAFRGIPGTMTVAE